MAPSLARNRPERRSKQTSPQNLSSLHPATQSRSPMVFRVGQCHLHHYRRHANHLFLQLALSPLYLEKMISLTCPLSLVVNVAERARKVAIDNDLAEDARMLAFPPNFASVKTKEMAVKGAMVAIWASPLRRKRCPLPQRFYLPLRSQSVPLW